ncbi:N-acetyl-glucosamine-6-phosphate deacetylase [Ceratobasidium sp. 414]|nr:N-acetyl-glucosamine-6-phosphate deacetylase [Ceratobasidium sp. 414]
MFPLSVSLALVALLTANPAQAIWPRPTQLTSGQTALRLSPSVSISLPDGAPPDLKDAAGRTQAQLKDDKFERLIVGRGSSDAARIRSARELSNLVLAYGSGYTANGTTLQAEATAPLGVRDEAYTLSVPADGSAATITANSTLGLFRGLTTFTQLCYGSDIYTVEAPYTIADKPAYVRVQPNFYLAPYRGLLLDTSRHYFPVSDIKRTIDAMSWVKLNQFHWHIVDAASFPLVVPGFPELSAKGAHSADEVYSQADVKDILTYAAQRGVDVMLEIDTPGHTAAIGESHPEHIACFHSNPWSDVSPSPPAGQLRFASPAVQKFIADVFSAVLSPLKDLGTLFSTGGDEVNTNCYAEDQSVQNKLKEQNIPIDDALDKFTNVTHAAVRSAGRTPVVWEEMVLNHRVTLPKDTITLVWISSANVAAVVRKGYRIIHAASDYFYLDCGGGEWADGASGNGCTPFKAWRKVGNVLGLTRTQLTHSAIQIYSFDPLKGVTKDQAGLVLGGQTLLWAEQSDPSNLVKPSFVDCIVHTLERSADGKPNRILKCGQGPRLAQKYSGRDLTVTWLKQRPVCTTCATAWSDAVSELSQYNHIGARYAPSQNVARVFTHIILRL